MLLYSMLPNISYLFPVTKTGASYDAYFEVEKEALIAK